MQKPKSQKAKFRPCFCKSPLILVPWNYFLFLGAKNGFSDVVFDLPNLEI